MKRIVSLLIAVLLALNTSTAFADSCSVALIPAFTPQQAVKLCATFPISSVATATLRPDASNTLDLGATSFPWRTLYLGTSRISLTSDILRVEQDAQRLFTWDASSDTAFTATFGDGGTTATQILVSSASTADADDDSTWRLCGGGGYSATGSRGACISLPGEEVAGGGDIAYVAGASDTHVFSAGSTQTMSIGATGLVTTAAGLTNTTGATTNSAAADFIVSTSGGTLSLQEATAGAACSGTLTANGATPVVTSTTCATTGSRVFLSRTSAETGTVNAWKSALSNGVSFSITSEAADTGTYDWLIVHEAP